MLKFLIAWKARRTVVRTISPWIALTERRRGPIPPDVWRNPYLVGFTSMLITQIILKHTRGGVSGDQLALIQLQAWQQVTGITDHRIGEEILLLSSRGDAEFAKGCLNARRFLNAVYGQGDLDDPEWAEILQESFSEVAATALVDIDLEPFGQGGQIARALWVRYFEVY